MKQATHNITNIFNILWHFKIEIKRNTTKNIFDKTKDVENRHLLKLAMPYTFQLFLLNAS